MSDPYAVTGTIWIVCDACNAIHKITIDQPTHIAALTLPEPIGWELSPEGDRCPECVAAHRQVAHARTVTATITAPEWPETLARLAAQADAAQNIDATLWPTSQRAIARARAAALSTQPATRTRPQPPAAPQGAPARPSKR